MVHEWNVHLEIFSRPQAEENFRQNLLLRTDILQKTVVGCPWTILRQSAKDINKIKYYFQQQEENLVIL